jgi:hypothetical protein
VNNKQALAILNIIAIELKNLNKAQHEPFATTTHDVINELNSAGEGKWQINNTPGISTEGVNQRGSDLTAGQISRNKPIDQKPPLVPNEPFSPNGSLSSRHAEFKWWKPLDDHIKAIASKPKQGKLL